MPRGARAKLGKRKMDEHGEQEGSCKTPRGSRNSSSGHYTSHVKIWFIKSSSGASIMIVFPTNRQRGWGQAAVRHAHEHGLHFDVDNTFDANPLDKLLVKINARSQCRESFTALEFAVKRDIISFIRLFGLIARGGSEPQEITFPKPGLSGPEAESFAKSIVPPTFLANVPNTVSKKNPVC